MSIITSPWIAVDIGADRIYVAYLDAFATARSVRPDNGEFDSVFHVSRSGKIRFGRNAAERLADDPEGIVLLSTSSFKNDAMIHFPDGRLSIRPSLLLTALLQRVRQYCEEHPFRGASLETCVLTLPRRSDRLRQTLSRVAWEAGFTKIHFRDRAIATETFRRHVWSKTFPYVTICTLGASRVSFTLLKDRHGGCERVDQFGSIGTAGTDEIDRIILQSADPGNIVPVDSCDARLQLRVLRASYSLDKEESFHLYLNGRKKKVRTVHFETATRIFIQRILVRLKVYTARALEITGATDIPIALAGSGANNPLIAQAIENATAGEVFWWPEAEEAGALGTAMMFLPKSKPEAPTENEERFFRDYEKALKGDAESCCMVAQALETGNGTAVSREEAFDWYRLAAQQGSLAGMCHLARCYFRGVGTAKAPKASVPWLVESAQAGYAPSQYALAGYLFKSEPQSHRATEGWDWMRLAADQGYTKALSYINQHLPQPPLDDDQSKITEKDVPSENVTD